MERNEAHSARDFSDAQLKPEPLRLPPKTQSSPGREAASPKHVRIDQAATEAEHHSKDFVDSTLAQTTTSDLAALVSKFEMLDAVIDAGTRARRHSVNLASQQHAPALPYSVQELSNNRSLARLPTVPPGSGNVNIDRVAGATLSLADMVRRVPVNQDIGTASTTHRDRDTEDGLGQAGKFGD
jgi:hypothetical protein